jgi:dTDP-4-dehydrorhamnose reductase
MFLLLGNTLVSQAFVAELQLRGQAFVQISFDDADLVNVNVLFDCVRRVKPTFLINAGALCESPGKLYTETDKESALRANVLLPQTVAHVCQMRNIPWGHVSSGTIFRGLKLREGRQWLAEISPPAPRIQALVDSDPPQARGFTEQDEPNHCFVCPPCDFFSGTLALGESAIKDFGRAYIWRPGVFFLDQHHPHNLLSRILSHLESNGADARDANRSEAQVSQQFISATHLGDFAATCLDLWALRAPFGTYQVTNPGLVSLRKLIGQCNRTARKGHFSGFGASDHCPHAAAPESFYLDTSKLARAGIVLRPASEALRTSLDILSSPRKETRDGKAFRPVVQQTHL